MNAQDTRLFLKSLGLALIHASEEIELPGDPASTARVADLPFDLPPSMQTQPPVAQPPASQLPTTQPPMAQPSGEAQAQPPGQTHAQPPGQTQASATQLPPIDDTAAAQAFCQELNRLNRECGGMMDVFQALFAQYLPEGGGCSKVKPEHRDAFLTQASEAARKVALSRGISM